MLSLCYFYNKPGQPIPTFLLLLLTVNMSHWHNVYKISLSSSPVEKSLEFDADDPLLTARDKRLSLLSGNLPIEEETALRSFLTPKINKHDLQEISIITTVDQPFMEDVPTQLYYKVINGSSGIINVEDQDNISEVVQFLVCFIVPSASGLDLFQEDLDAYCNELSPYLEKCMESIDISEYLKFVESWYEKNICFVERCLEYFSCQLAVLICIGFCGSSVVISQNAPVDSKEDIERFLQCCSLSPLFMETSLELVSSYSSSSMQDMVTLSNSETVNITYEEEGIFLVQTTKVTTFCKECVDGMQNMKAPTAIKLRQLLQNYKLKSIQYMNSFKRMIRDAETDYYVLYKTFLFLITCGNGLVLLHNAKLQNSIENYCSSKEVLDTLEMFIDRMGGFVILDTIENKQNFKLKLEA